MFPLQDASQFSPTEVTLRARAGQLVDAGARIVASFFVCLRQSSFQDKRAAAGPTRECVWRKWPRRKSVAFGLPRSCAKEPEIYTP